MISGRIPWLALCVSIAATALLAPWALAQQTRDDTTTLQVYSRLTVLDVTATGPDGSPVRGLQKSDFTIIEDGKPQIIRNFEEVTSTPSAPLPQLPPRVYTNLQPRSPSSAVNILLLDFLNEAPIDNTDDIQLSKSLAAQKRVKDAAITAIQKMPAGTRIAVLLMDTHLRILQSFTPDRNLLIAAIGAAPFDTEGNGDLHCIQSNNRNRSVLEALDQIAVSSAAIKGRKNLIWFTAGISAITDPSQRPSCLPDYSRGLSHAYDLLTAAQVSIYPVSALGVRSPEGGDDVAPSMGPEELSMQALAEATGGAAYSQTNDMSTAVLKSIEDGANYYSVAYTPPHAKYDGTYHRIEVKVDRPGINLVFRKGYYSDDLSKEKLAPGLTLSVSPPSARNGDMKAPMSRNLPTSQRILFDVEVTPSTVPAKPGEPPILGTLDPKLRGKRLTRYAFQYMIPSQQIAFAEGPDHTQKDSLGLDIAVYDANNRLLTGLSQVLNMSLTDASYHTQIAHREPIRFTQQIDLPPGQLFIRVGVLDDAAAKYGTLDLPLNTDKPSAATASGT